MKNRILSKNVLKFIGKNVIMAGWVNARRDHGKIIFIDIRDSSGLTQIVFTPKNAKTYDLATTLRSEYVIKVIGKINKRPVKMVNPKIASGKVEMDVKKLEILSQAKTLPFEITKNTINIDEETRLKYRYLDLRTQRMAEHIRNKHKIIQFIRNYLTGNDFVEIQTPILTKSTPEGARDYIVPSRKHPGKFFALPQSPQQYKQLLMVAGFEKYFQIAPCFRDEDARADRSPGEFYQLDLEMSFVTQNEILDLIEKLFTDLVKKMFPKKKITFTPWPRLKYSDVMKKYKTDKPDLRRNKNDLDELAFAWIIDFPLFVKQTKNDFFHGAGKKLAPSHHMFTAPKVEDLKLLEKYPEKVRSSQHDLILNGFEVGGGSIRIHNPRIQEKIFDLIEFTNEQKEQFAHLLRAFEYGVPPHGGIAPGIDRLTQILCREDTIKEVIAFPLTGEVRDPLMNTPNVVSKKQLLEVHIKNMASMKNIKKTYKKL